MDEPLTPHPLSAARHAIATAYLAAPSVLTDLGDIQLAPHQVDAARRLLALLEVHGGALLADGTGMGKTYVALAVARALGTALVVAPAALRDMWIDALRRAHVAAEVESYERLSHGVARPDARPELVILDEAHHARNPTSKRYAALVDLAWGSRLLLVTATPIHNRRRDLQGLLALFLGSQAYALSPDGCAALTVRRSRHTPGHGWSARLPSVGPTRWYTVSPDRATFRALQELPPPVPPSDGGTAHALLVIGLVRAWCSSTAALHEMLRRRLARGIALSQALEEGRHPSRAELSAWSTLDGAIQLVFPGLVTSNIEVPGVRPMLDAIRAHCDAVRAIIGHIGGDRRDTERSSYLDSVRREAAPDPVVAFTQFTDTASSLYHSLCHTGGVALVTGRGARIASGRVPVGDVVRGFDIDTARDSRMPLELLIASDVLSEGLSLRRARVLVHLDLPWTMARLEQRLGRVRRLGSPHQRVEVRAIGPPVTTGALSRVVRVLQRKARVTATFGGSADLEAPIGGTNLELATRRIIARGDIDAIESLRAILGSWLGPDRRMPELPVTCGIVTPRGRLSCDWAAIVLVRRGRRVVLLAVSPEGVSERPMEVLPLVRLVDADTPALDAALRSTAMRACRARVERWLEEQQAGDLVAPVTHAPSPAHAAVLRYLDGLMAGAGRVDKLMRAYQVQRCRAEVVAARGAGAELALEKWLSERTARHDPTESMVTLDELTRQLSSRRGPEGTGPETYSVEAVVVLAGSARSRPPTLHA